MMLLYHYLLLAFLFYMVYWILTYRSRSLSILPGPVSLPLIGSMYMVDTSYLVKTLDECLQKYGRLSRVNLPTPVVFTNDPEIMKQIFTTHMAHYDRDPRVVSIFGDIIGLAGTSNGDEWKFFRELFTPAFTYENLLSLRPLVISKVLDLSTRLEGFAKSGEVFDIQEWAKHLTFDIIGVVALGVEFGGLKSPDGHSRYETAWKHILAHAMHRYIMFDLPYWKLFSTASTRRFDADMALMKGAISEKLRMMKAGPIDPNDGSMIAHLLRNEKARNMPEEVHLRYLMGFLFGGHDTTSTLISWLLYELSHNKNPEIEQRLVNEVTTVNVAALVESECDKTLGYLKAVISEGVRAHPPVQTDGRYQTSDQTLTWTDSAGVQRTATLPKGTTWQLSFHSMSQDPTAWPDPTKFDPERFLSKRDDSKHPYQYVPFGGGPRRCIGERLALMETRIALIMLLSKFEFESMNTPKPAQLSTLESLNGLKMRVRLRSSKP